MLWSLLFLVVVWQGREMILSGDPAQTILAIMSVTMLTIMFSASLIADAIKSRKV
jgi:hypothetical protein